MSKLKLSPLSLLEIIVIASILLSGLALFLFERQNHDLDYKKSWASLYFVDSYSPEKGVKLENHLEKNTDFAFCLIKDNDDLTEPDDLSCDLEGVLASKRNFVSTGETTLFNYDRPKEQGKYWVLTVYKDVDNAEQKRSLSFNVN